MQLFSIYVFAVTIAAVASLDHSKCFSHTMKNAADFEVQCSSTDNSNIKIICHSVDWTQFPNVTIDLPVIFEIEFNNCSFPVEINVQNILNRLKVVGRYEKIIFDKLRSTPNRQNLRGLDIPCLNLTVSNFTQLPFDLLYDTLNVQHLNIRGTQLASIPDDFFREWAKNVIEIDMSHNKLQKIAKDNFSQLGSVISMNISNNEIREIEPGTFDSLVLLEQLILDNNQLHTLPNAIFDQLGSLRHLHLSGNTFNRLPSNLLAKTSHLVWFHFTGNKGNLTNLPDGFFKNLKYLIAVNLPSNRLKSLPSTLFAGCSAIGYLDFSENQLKNLPSGLFNDTKNLRLANLKKNHLESLPAGIFEGLDRLEHLYISDNRLTSLMPKHLEGLESVELFDASRNNLIHVDYQFVKYLKSARTINLSNNQLTFNSRGKIESLDYQETLTSTDSSSQTAISLSGNQNNQQSNNLDQSITLKYINLSNNMIDQIDDELISLLKYSNNFDLKNNRISKIKLSDFSLRIFMHERSDVFGKTTTEYTKVDLSNNRLQCDCDLSNFVRFARSIENEVYNKIFVGDQLTCASPLELKNQNVLSVRTKDLKCMLKSRNPDDACNEMCICQKRPENQVLSVDCSHKNLTQFPLAIKNLQNWSIELNMSNNILHDTPLINYSYLQNVTSLDLSNNDITEITIGLFLPTLHHLKLHANRISRLDSEVIGYLAHNNNTLRSITLHDNRWICDCEARELLAFVQKKFTNYNFDEIICHRTNRKLYKMTVSELCTNMILIMTIASISIAFFGIFVVSSVVLYYKYQREIKVWLYSKQWCLCWVTEDELDKDKEYDAFVSFSHKDEDFVEMEIVAKLEEGPRPYKLCLHYRDWLAGEWIPVQISRSVEKSRRTIIVLTPHFLKSVWGLLEFRAAHTQALKEGRNRVIIILYGEIGNIEDLDQEMKVYLRQNTYIKWGDPWFWDKLRYALPHAKEFTKHNMKNIEIERNHSVELLLTNSIDNNATGKCEVISIPKNTSYFVNH